MTPGTVTSPRRGLPTTSVVAADALAHRLLQNSAGQRASAYAHRRLLGTAAVADLHASLQGVRELLADRVAAREAAHPHRALAAEIQAIEHQDRAVQIEVHRDLRAMLDRLGRSTTTDAVLAPSAQDLCEACGFTRAMVSSVEGTRWVPAVAHSQPHLDAAAEAFGALPTDHEPIRLIPRAAETEMVHRRAAMLVPDADLGTWLEERSDRRHEPAGYVAAPVLVGGQVVGFLHADRAGQTWAVNDDDRRAIAVFAAGFAALFERIALDARLLTRSRRLEAANSRARTAVAAIAARSPAAVLDDPEPSTRVAAPRGGGICRDPLLTTREAEVLALVAEGATNASIAARLGIAEGTVKTHVKRILRKLRVPSRGAAVARFRRVSGAAGG